MQSGRFFIHQHPGAFEREFYQQVMYVRESQDRTKLLCHIRIPYLDVQISDGNKRLRRKVENRSDESSSEEPYSAEWSYDTDNQPEIGEEHQADINYALSGEVEEATEKEKIGAMVWCPERVSSREELAQYLANVRATPELDKDIFAILISERGDFQAVLQLYNSLCTQEEALQILQESEYNADAAEKKMREKNLLWSLYKRPLKVWNKADVTDFEVGLNNHNKSFRDVLQYEMGCSEKTLKEVIEFYYVWKKTERYSNWDKENAPGSSTGPKGGAGPTRRYLNKPGLLKTRTIANPNGGRKRKASTNDEHPSKKRKTSAGLYPFDIVIHADIDVARILNEEDKIELSKLTGIKIDTPIVKLERDQEPEPEAPTMNAEGETTYAEAPVPCDVETDEGDASAKQLTCSESSEAIDSPEESGEVEGGEGEEVKTESERGPLEVQQQAIEEVTENGKL